MSNPRADVERKARAESLLRDPLIIEAFETLETEFVAAWKQSAIADKSVRPACMTACAMACRALRDMSKPFNQARN